MLNKHAPLRKKLLRANHVPYITKTLKKVIMRRSRFETKYIKIKAQTDLKLCKNHKRFCSKLFKNEMRKYYESLDMKNVLDSRKFWKTMGLFFLMKARFSRTLA